MPPPGSPILIDGSHGEGGGALVRTALTMSALTQQAVRIDHVRTGTKFPGLDYEDVVLATALAKSCQAETRGLEPGSLSVSFLPTKKAGALQGSLDLPDESGRRSASTPVVLNSLLPVLAKSGAYSSVTLSGETYGHRSLGFDYLANVTLPVLSKAGLYAFPDQEEAGFGRESGGRVSIDIEPSSINGLAWGERGKLKSCRAVITTAELPQSVAERAASHLSRLSQSAKLKMEIDLNPVDARSAGAFVTLWTEFERGWGGSTSMGQRGIKIESVAQSAFEELLDWLSTDATVDPFLADQILIPLVVGESSSTIKTNRLTQRLLTMIWVVKQFLPIHITILGKENEAGTITIKK